jgi:hypothetical protein
VGAVYAASEESSIEVWKIDGDGELTATEPIQEGPLVAACTDPKRRYLLTGSTAIDPAGMSEQKAVVLVFEFNNPWEPVDEEWEGSS